MIPANYLSMVVGWIALASIWAPVQKALPGRAPLFKVPLQLVLFIVLSWAASIVIEAPFCLAALWKGRPNVGSVIRAAFLTQTASYAVIVPLYYLISPLSLYRTASIQQSLDFVRPTTAVILYINAQDGWVWRIDPDGSGKRRVIDAHIHDTDSRLFLKPSKSPGRLDLWQNGGGGGELVCRDIGVGVTPSDPDSERAKERGIYMGFGRGDDLRPPAERKLTVYAPFWAGLIVRERGGSDYDVSFETPFQSWRCRCPTILTTNQVVFQLATGDDAQLVILDLKTRNLGFIAMGQGPVVVPQMAAYIGATDHERPRQLPS